MGLEVVGSIRLTLPNATFQPLFPLHWENSTIWRLRNLMVNDHSRL
jgi:hypothetical protein